MITPDFQLKNKLLCMSIPQEQYERMIDYFEGRLSTENEVTFLNEVVGDAELRKEFNMELLLRHRQFTDEDETEETSHGPEPFEPADTHIQSVKEAWKVADKEDPQKSTPVIRMKQALQIAAMLVVVIGAALVYILYFKDKPALVIKDRPAKRDTARLTKKDTLPSAKPADRLLAENNDLSYKIYKEFYKKYAGTEEDPIQVSKFLYAYNSGRYDEVIGATEKELSNKGGAANTPALKTYLDFYQGISYLHLHKSKQAITKFREVVRRSPEKDHVYGDATWYLALACLQDNNVTDARYFLRRLADSKTNSSYKKKANDVLKLLQ